MTLRRRVNSLTLDEAHSDSRWSTRLNQLTLSGFDEEGQGTGIDHEEANVVGSSLDHLMGTWSKDEADRIDRALKDFSHIDEAMWM